MSVTAWFSLFRVDRLDSQPAAGYGADAGGGSAIMSPKTDVRPYLIFTGTGPILVLSTYPELFDSRLVEKLRYKGIVKFIAYEVSLAAVKERYARAYENVAADLAAVEDLRVLDFNGHQIMTNFSLSELGEPIKFEG
ncbi:MAG: hypothetical protein QG573_2177 [Acidobacteriota bacterium]|nr:hypothetical protein [Acidobacteriota bacterium]